MHSVQEDLHYSKYVVVLVIYWQLRASSPSKQVHIVVLVWAGEDGLQSFSNFPIYPEKKCCHGSFVTKMVRYLQSFSEGKKDVMKRLRSNNLIT